MVKSLTAVVAFCLVNAVAAQQLGPALSIDAGAGCHAISPDIYGINFYWDLGTSGDPQGAAYATVRADVLNVSNASRRITEMKFTIAFVAVTLFVIVTAVAGPGTQHFGPFVLNTTDGGIVR